jgi:Protein kinase domain
MRADVSAQQLHHDLNRLLGEQPDTPTRVLPRGTTIDGFVLTGTAAEEPEYVLYLASLGRFGAPAMLKLFDPSPLHDAAYYRRLRRAARRWKRVEHPNLVRLAAARKSPRGPYLATAPFAGPTLAKVLRDGALRPAAAATIVAELAAALDALIDQGLVTGALSTAEIVLARSGTLLTDPGVGRTHAGSGLAESPRVVGYLSPEVAVDTAPVPQSAVYSLACVLHACLTGAPPYESQLPHATVYAHLSEPPPRPSETHEELPPELDLVFERAMAADPNERYATPGELAREAAVALGLRASELTPPAREETVSGEIPVPAFSGNGHSNGNGAGEPSALEVQEADVVSADRLLEAASAAAARLRVWIERFRRPLLVAAALAVSVTAGAIAGSAGDDSAPKPRPAPAPVTSSAASAAVLSELQGDRSALRETLASADTRADQARAARDLAAAHRRAEAGLSGPGAAEAREALAASAAAYAALARAASAGDPGAWRLAREEARQADSSLTQALRPAP